MSYSGSPRGRRWMGLVFAILFAGVALVAINVTLLPMSIVQIAPLGAASPTTISILSGGKEIYSRVETNDAIRNLEVFLWRSLPLTSMALSAVVGWHVGRWISRRWIHKGPAPGASA